MQMTSTRPGDGSDRILWIYTIYHQPKVEPDRPYRVRAFAVENGKSLPGPDLGSAITLAAAREMVPQSADVQYHREAGDAPEIVESWM